MQSSSSLTYLLTGETCGEKLFLTYLNKSKDLILTNFSVEVEHLKKKSQVQIIPIFGHETLLNLSRANYHRAKLVFVFIDVMSLEAPKMAQFWKKEFQVNAPSLILFLVGCNIEERNLFMNSARLQEHKQEEIVTTLKGVTLAKELGYNKYLEVMRTSFAAQNLIQQATELVFSKNLNSKLKLNKEELENLTTRLKKREYRRAIRLSRELCLDDSFIPSNGPPSPRRSRSVLDNRGSGNSNIIDLVDSAINGRSRGETII